MHQTHELFFAPPAVDVTVLGVTARVEIKTSTK